ncbi:MAG TPA: 23S rRNA (guanosine(2251)-2'-O)-methyltransferase RlmB, partial [Gammaproteobacteria bacterium]|nr:23S rRNA (guanosine(2251)-2'-O)-methyltransferase RlmB [Gammaproteobacteria bacterium]
LEELLKKDSLLFLILDHVTDPQNVGACLRSAAAANVDAVIVPKNRSCHLTPTVRKISSGGSELIPFVIVTNLIRTLKKMKLTGVEIIGTEKSASEPSPAVCLAPPPDHKIHRNKNALVIGSENKGLRKLTAENCDRLIRIDMPGPMESLNASVACGILLFEFIRKF